MDRNSDGSVDALLAMIIKILLNERKKTEGDETMRISREVIKTLVWEQHGGMDPQSLDSEIEMILWWEKTRERALEMELEKQIKDIVVWYLSGDKKEH